MSEEIKEEKPKRRLRKYEPSDIVVALATLKACKGNLMHASEKLGIPMATLRSWARGHRPKVVTQEIWDAVDTSTVLLSDKLEKIAHLLINNLAIRLESSLSATTPLKDVATTLGIVIDKRQILIGEPDSIQRVLPPITREARDKRVVELLDKGKQELEKKKLSLVPDPEKQENMA